MDQIKNIIKSIKIFGILGALNLYYYKVKFIFLKKILEKKIAVRKIHGSKMFLDLVNPGISQVLYLFGSREDLDVDIVKKELKPGMNVLEAGANIGYYLLLEGRLLNGRGIIYAFEPDPRNIKFLKMNIKLNKLENNVKFYPYAVADKNSIEKFYLTSASNLNTMISGHKAEESQIEVKTVRIDEFPEIDKPVNFIRMDIEGYEYEAISGMLETLKRNLPVKLLIELHPWNYNKKRDFPGVLEELFKLGFRVKYAVSAGHHSPEEIINLGYKPIKISREIKHSHGLYENIKKADFISLIKKPDKIIRSVLLVKE